MISIWAVEVSTPQERFWYMASSSAQVSLLLSSSKAWSTAATDTAAPAAGLPLGSLASIVTLAVLRMR